MTKALRRAVCAGPMRYPRPGGGAWSWRRHLLASTALLPLALFAAPLTFISAPALAACITTGTATVCDTSAPNPETSTVGTGPTAPFGASVDVLPGAQIIVGDQSAISLADQANIRIRNGAVVSAAATSTPGNYGTGGNTIEFRNNGLLLIDQGGQVLAVGTDGQGEPLNFQGTGNTLINSGLIQASVAVAIWSQNVTGQNTVVNTETGVIQAPGTVIGGSGNGALDFTNRGQVIGNVVLAGGDDTFRIFTGSSVTGFVNGGAGTDAVFLSGDGIGAIPGAFTNFETLTKNGLSTWTLTSAIGGVNLVTVDQGTLILTGDNSAYAGGFVVNAAGILQARAQSLPPSIANNGLVRFAQPDPGTYTGLISGTGAVEKTGAGVLTLAPAAPGGNTYSGGTFLNEGTINVSADNALGAPTGGLTFNGGTLQFGGAFTLSGARGVVINAPGGTIDTQGFAGTIASAITGAGGLTKLGAGVLTLTGTNTFTGGTTITAGTLQLGNGGTSGGLLGDILNNAALTFNRSDTFILPGVISGTGTVSQAGTGTTILTGASTYTGGTTIIAGTLQLGNGGVSGSIVGDVVNNGRLAFNRSDVTTFGGTIAGTGAVSQIGTGTTILNGNNPFTGGTTATAGTLAIGDAANPGAVLSGGGPIAIGPGGTLGGYGGVTGAVTNNGTLGVANAIAAFAGGPGGNFTVNGALFNSGLAQVGGSGIGNTLTIASNYVGQGGTVGLNTFLGGDGSPSDRLVIDGGTATGLSGLRITNVGGLGALTSGNGILLVDAVNGGTTNAGAFTLTGALVAGPYEYTLFRGGSDGASADDWFLRSHQVLGPTGPLPAPNYRPEVSLYTALPSMALIYGGTLVDTLHERVGETEQLRGRTDPASGSAVNGAWGRVIAQHGNVDGGPGGIYRDGPNFDYNLYAFQAGLDLFRKEHADGSRDHAGAYVAIGQVDGDVQHYNGLRAGSNTFDAQTLGAYWTHFGPSGWYVDGVVQGTWYASKANSGRVAELKTDGFGVAASLEGGYPIQLGNGFIIEPQAQLVYQSVSLDDASDTGGLVRFDDAQSLSARIGVRGARTWLLEAGATPRLLTAWLRANLRQEFLGDSKTGFSSPAGFVPFRSDIGGTIAELNGGGTAQLSRTAALFASAGYQVGIDGRTHTYDGKLGLRVNW